MRKSVHSKQSRVVGRLGAALAASVLALAASSTAYADPPWQRHGHQKWHRYGDHDRVVVEHQYYAPRERVIVVHQPPVVHERVIVQSYEPYYPPPAPAYPQYYEPPVAYGPGSNVFAGAVLGAAGGFLGSQVGHGDERAAATAAGAVAGWVLGTGLGR